jgi:hypothetical protein
MAALLDFRGEQQHSISWADAPTITPIDAEPPRRTRSRTPPPRREPRPSRKSRRRKDHEAALAATLAALGDALDEADAEVAELYERRPYPEPETVETFLACPAPARRRPKAPGPETRATEAMRGYFRCERALRGGLNDVATPACERRLLEWLGDGRPLSPTSMLAQNGLKLEAPYGSSARGRLVAHAGARFHGCPSKTLDDATVLVERPRSPSHSLRHGATISDVFAPSRGRRL